MKTNNHSEIFLATTALEEFWDTTKPLVFLGEWCTRYSRRSCWEPLQGEILKNPWNNEKKIHEAYLYVNEVYEYILPILAKQLNQIHGIDKSNRYWQIILGPWLLYYISTIYDRYTRLKLALDIYPGLTTMVLAPEDFNIPIDTNHFTDLIIDDPYNLQIITRLFQMMGKNFSEKAIFNTPEKHVSMVHYGLKKIAKSLWYWFLDDNANDGVVMQNSYFSRDNEFRLKIKLKSKLAVCNNNVYEIKQCKMNPEMREGLNQITLELSDSFVQVLIQLLPLDLPYCFLERFNELRAEAAGRYKRYTNPKAIFSCNAWYGDEVFKCWVAESAEKGVILLGGQHGGMYGINENMLHEYYELSIVDRFYSWGWQIRGMDEEKIMPMPASKLASSKYIINNIDVKNDILLVVNMWPRYIFRFLPILPHQKVDYLNWQFRFVDALTLETQNSLRIRTYQNDFGWDYRKRWEDTHPEVILEDWKIPFAKRIEKCSLVVCDNSGTTFLESMAINKPTLLYWNPDSNYIRPDAQPYFDELIRVGILYDNPENAAIAVNSIHNNVESWWTDSELQKVRVLFCQQFARTESSGMDIWTDEFNRIINGK